MAAPVVASPALAIAGRDTLFTGPFTTEPWHPNYDVAPDGKSFVMLRPLEQHRQLVMVDELGSRSCGGGRRERNDGD